MQEGRAVSRGGGGGEGGLQQCVVHVEANRLDAAQVHGAVAEHRSVGLAIWGGAGDQVFQQTLRGRIKGSMDAIHSLSASLELCKQPRQKGNFDDSSRAKTLKP